MTNPEVPPGRANRARALRLSIALAILGLAVDTALIAWFGAGLVFREVASIGPGGFALVCAWQMVLFASLGLAWWVLLPRPIPLRVTIWGRMVRDSAGNCLPFSQVGGFVAGARATVLLDLPWTLAAASTAADIAAELLAQLVFVATGVAILASRHPGSKLVAPGLAGLGVGCVAAAGFVWAQRGGSQRFAGIADRLLRALHLDAAGQIAGIRAALDAIYAARRRFALCILLHVVNWLGTGVADWIAYNLLGAPIDLAAAIAIDALLHAALSVAVLVPGYAGVQEAVYAAVGTWFGQPPAISLAVSLLRRSRDIALGVPILLVWQGMEWKRRENVLS